jgi:microcompartment protein CcmL/EutN
VAHVRGPAVALLELDSIARGMIAADAVLKRAPVEIALAEPVTPGKYLLLFSGGVAEVEESVQAGVQAAGNTLLDKLFLPQAAKRLVAGLRGEFHRGQGESVGIVETQTVASALLSLDTALKRAEVLLTRLHLARGIGGKGYYTLTGELHMMEAALEAAAAAIEPSLLVATELIQSPHPELRGPVL